MTARAVKLRLAQVTNHNVACDGRRSEPGLLVQCTLKGPAGSASDGRWPGLTGRTYGQSLRVRLSAWPGAHLLPSRPAPLVGGCRLRAWLPPGRRREGNGTSS